MGRHEQKTGIGSCEFGQPHGQQQVWRRPVRQGGVACVGLDHGVDEKVSKAPAERRDDCVEAGGGVGGCDGVACEVAEPLEARENSAEALQLLEGKVNVQQQWVALGGDRRDNDAPRRRCRWHGASLGLGALTVERPPG